MTEQEEFDKAWDNDEYSEESPEKDDSEKAEDERDESVEEPEKESQGDESQEDDQGKEEPEKGEPDDIRAELERLKKRNEILEHKFRSDRGRIRKANELLKKYKLEGKLEKADLDAPPSDEKEISSKIDTMEPEDVASQIARLGQAIEQRDAVIASLNEKLARLEGYVVEHASSVPDGTDDTKMELLALEERHPDWKKYGPDNQEFWSWVETQHPNIKELAGSDYARDVSYVLDLYKSTVAIKARQKQTQKKNERLEAAKQNPSAGLSGALRQKIPKDDYDAAWDAYE